MDLNYGLNFLSDGWVALDVSSEVFEYIAKNVSVTSLLSSPKLFLIKLFFLTRLLELLWFLKFDMDSLLSSNRLFFLLFYWIFICLSNILKVLRPRMNLVRQRVWQLIAMWTRKVIVLLLGIVVAKEHF